MTEIGMPGRAGDGEVGKAEAVRNAFDGMPVIMVATRGPDHEIVAANAAFRTSTGRAEPVGRTVAQAFPEVAGQQIYAMYDRVYETGETQTALEWHIQFDAAGNGRLIDVWYDFTVTARRSPDGAIAGTALVCADVSERVRERQAAEQRARVSETRFAPAIDVVSTLQGALLPAGVPVLPEARTAATYLLADAETAGGGDWFDAVSLADGRLALVVGDVVGHGVTASAVMGQLRILLQERLIATGDITAAVRAVDRMAAHLPGAHAATVCVVLLDPASGNLAYCTAGHPPPLILPRDDDGRYLPATGSRPLGVDPGGGTAVEVRRARLEYGDMILLYTDGMLERPGRTLSQATVELAQVATDAFADRVLRGNPATASDRVCAQTLELLTRPTGHCDDITLLAAQRTYPPARFQAHFPAGTTLLRDIRRMLFDWMAGFDVSDDDSVAVQHAITEFATNAMEHAYIDSADPDNAITITGALTPTGHLHATVRDHGQWREPRPSHDRGRGLLLASHVADRVYVAHDDSGTTAVVEKQLSHPARLLTVAELTSGTVQNPDKRADPFLVLDQPAAASPRIRVDGPIDGETAPQFDHALRTASAVGTRDLTVDLTGVTLLSSAGVAVLHRLATLSDANGHPLALFAPRGTAADMIMTLVHLSHVNTDPDISTI